MTGGRPTVDGGRPDPSLFEAFPDPLVVYTSDDRSDDGDEVDDAGERSLVVRAVNPAFESAFDVAADEVTRASLTEVELRGAVETAPFGDDPATTESSPAATLRSVLDRVAGGAGTTARFHYEPDGQRRHFRVRVITVGAADDTGYLLFTDDTELAERRRDLATAVEQLERIASVASHDLRNPLEVARIRLEAARDTGEDVHFEKIAGALDRIEHIARDVLAVGGGRVDPTDEIALDAVAEAAWDTVDTGGATLVTASGLPTVRGDPDYLQQLFENLFRNAVEHGGREVTVTVEPLSDGFAVADDGPGISSDDRESIFEAGYSTAPGNSGLGLSIVRRIAREHGWQVTLVPPSESGADGGARFAFTGVDRVESEADEADDGDDST